MSERKTAFIIHLGISLLIALVAVALVFLVWHPTPLHTAVGVTKIFAIVLAVDVVLGPLLTLLVYKVGKKTLVMDLSIIILMQIAALSYGLFTVAEGRPAWLVFAKDRFVLVRAMDIDERKLGEADTQYHQPSLVGPKWVFATSPSDNEQRNDILLESLFSGVDIAQRPNLYQPLNQHKAAIQQRLLDLPVLELFNSATQLADTLTRYPQADTWLPLSANHQDMVVLMQRDSVEVVAIVELNPWH